jgi:tRNA C32,U32 (ribose-2'-O)-methylase TrmJ
MLGLLRRGLRAAGALPEQGADGAFREWEQMLQRADLSPREVRLLEHMARKMAGRGEA